MTLISTLGCTGRTKDEDFLIIFFVYSLHKYYIEEFILYKVHGRNSDSYEPPSLEVRCLSGFKMILSQFYFYKMYALKGKKDYNT